MTENSFLPPTPEILQWLAAGQLANRLQRSLRLWVLINKLYSSQTNWVNKLPTPFTYSQLRDCLFAYRHPKSDRINAQDITAQCSDRNCICHQTFSEIVFEQNFHLSVDKWQQSIIQLTGMSEEELQKALQQHPFATVHRSLRDDLKQLVRLGWLQITEIQKYRSVLIKDLPTPPTQTTPELSLFSLDLAQTWELLQILESIAFVQPNLSLIIGKLWEQIASSSASRGLYAKDPHQRIFLHLDYILSPQMQDRVDNYQEQLEQLWRKSSGSVVQFEYWIAATESKVKVTVYPVCLHYRRRAKYLSAYGTDPDNNVAWHNYRLDRIACDRLQLLAWNDPLIPTILKQMWQTGNLPIPSDVDRELKDAWGLNFYLKKEWLILRFPKEFAKWYVENTIRHPTFCEVSYNQLPKLIAQNISNEQERQQLLEIISQRSKDDAYYNAWIRDGDINVLMRLREWRPKGEVIAPLSIRRQMIAEVAQELANYSEK
ncbi:MULTISPECIES: TIGR03985 family CRISPR-associated protein [Nostocales]|uniref:CRISPR-associated protein, TIGR03985 family n=3 Tax=Nostocales TaxID=1161 RepID=A0A0C1NH08_9CYAN|nr:TIGR03985 family CRISPR-associated protein [Tolypothrix bouteillei]KAF3890577.1 TIGR03985 family CRISPR-associated protein [Tolypothrix bouteillei VB521301]